MRSFRDFVVLLALPVGLMRLLLEIGKERKKTTRIRAPSVKEEDFKLDPGKPNLILHVGPPKTGTSPIQDVLFHSLSEELRQDNIYYTDDNFYGSASPLMEEALNGAFQRNKCETNPSVACFAPLRKLLTTYRDRKTVVLSSEGFAKRFSTPAHYQALHKSLSYEWNVFVIVGYRRFYEWLPLKAFQGYRMDQLQNARWKVDWPGQKGKGTAVELVFPDMWKRWHSFYGGKPSYTTDVLHANNGTLPVRLFNLHHVQNEESLTTHFVCNLLPDASHTCASSRARDDARMLVDTDGQQEDVIHVFYDIVATTAAKRGLIDTVRFERQEIRESMRDYNERVLKRTAMDLDLDCPEVEELEQYLKQSRKYEKIALGKKAAKLSKEEHTMEFWTMAATRAFCYVDVGALLRQSVWQTFFAQYSAQVLSHRV